ncbi:MAG: response regulator [Proteobacteria bacterium]|nr:response regulator [Pseudomonadota bacterium]
MSTDRTMNTSSKWLPAAQIALIYAAVGSIWVLVSDQVLASFVSDAVLLTRLQTVKGWFYIVSTALVLFWLIWRQLASLQEANSEIVEILKAIPDLLFELDESGRYLNIWARDERLLAEQKTVLLGNLVKDILPETESIQVYKALSIAGKTGLSHGQVIHLKLPDGEHWFELSTSLKMSNDGSKHFIMLSRDITERIKTERQLRRAEKMDALGKLSGGIAHDYNNMLGVIIGYSDLLKMALGDQPKLQKYVHEIHHAGERGAKLTKKLLAISRQRIFNSDYSNINILLQDMRNVLEKTLTVRVNLVLDLATGLWTVWLDDGGFEDAILNMSINAMHAIEGNGELTIQTSNRTLTQIDALPLDITPGDYVLCSIVDTGCGMTQAIIEKIFEPFFSTKGEAGTGLGLSQVYDFMESSGGSIKVYSNPGKGTRITLYFPRKERSTRKDSSARDCLAAELNGTETILVVDDESSLLALCCDMLSEYGFNVIPADNAKMALDILEHTPVNLLISDIVMPEMDGYQLAAIVNQKYPKLKIQLTSGFADDSNMNTVNANLQKNLLVKPYSSHALLKRIRELLDENINETELYCI